MLPSMQQCTILWKKLCPALHRDKGRLPIASILLEKGIFYYIRTTTSHQHFPHQLCCDILLWGKQACQISNKNKGQFGLKNACYVRRDIKNDKQLTFFNLVTVVRPDDSLRPGNGPGLALDVNVVPGHPPLLRTALDLWGSGHLDFSRSGQNSILFC